MVDLRARSAQDLPEETQDLNALERLTPPAHDLMQALREQFPNSIEAVVKAHEDQPWDHAIGRIEGQQQVITFLQNILNSHTTERS